MRNSPTDDLAPPLGVFLLARQNNAAVGCVGLQALPPSTAEVRRLFVSLAARGQGIGSRLLRELESVARDHGVSRLRLDTRHDLEEAPPLCTSSTTMRKCPRSTTIRTSTTGSPRPSCDRPLR